MYNETATSVSCPALDFYDYTRGWSNLFKDVTPFVNSPSLSTRYFGVLLADNKAKARELMSEQIVASFSECLEPIDIRLGKDHCKAFRAGMTAGINVLKQHLKATRMGGIFPIGLSSRMRALGW